jgi:hypothetical protein
MLNHALINLSKADFKLDYDHNKPSGERLKLQSKVGKINIQSIELSDINIRAKDSLQGVDFNVTINSIARNNITLNGISAHVPLSHLWPLATAEPGRLTINKATLGMPVTNINATYRILGNNAEIKVLGADFANGRITLKPGKKSHAYILQADKLALDKLASFSRVKGLSMQGRINGRLPLHYNNDKGITIDDGRISGGKGGYIHYKPETYPAALQGNNMGMATTRKALRQLNLSQLELKLNGPVQSDLEANLTVKGKNPDFSDRPVHLNLNLSGAIMSAVQQGLNISFGRPNLDVIRQRIEK